MIPKKIHYCWFGGKPLPKSVENYKESWKKYCPDYEIIEWNESNYDVNSHPFTKAAYEAKAWAFVSDYARLKIIYENGGIYLDTDVELLRNLDFLLSNRFFIGMTQLGHYCTTGLGFGAENNSDVVRKMLNVYDNLMFDANKKRELACPALNDRVLRGLGHKISKDIEYLADDVCILPPYYMDPISPGDTKNLQCQDTISIHHYAASWESKTRIIKRRISLFIGQKRINEVKRILGLLR